MPFLYWLDSSRYIVASQWKDNRDEKYAKEAKAVDRNVDSILDNSLDKLSEIRNSQKNYKSHKEFFRDYAVGTSIIQSKILEHPFIIGDGSRDKPRELLVDSGNTDMIIDKGLNIAFYTAIGVKATLGKSLDFHEEVRWENLRPLRKDASKKGTKRAGGKKDIYARAVYLAEQELETALLTFGGKVDLVAGAFERSLESLALRNAIAKYHEQFVPEERERFYKREIRREMYKRLNKIFPKTGAGSSKSPDNYSGKELLDTLKTIWEEFEK